MEYGVWIDEIEQYIYLISLSFLQNGFEIINNHLKFDSNTVLEGEGTMKSSV